MIAFVILIVGSGFLIGLVIGNKIKARREAQAHHIPQFQTSWFTPPDSSPSYNADAGVPAQTQAEERPAFCPGCGAPVPPGGKFCGKCGFRL